MGVTEELLVKISADTASLKDGLAKATDTIKEFSSTTFTEFSSMISLVEKFGGGLLEFGKSFSAMGSEVEAINLQFERSMKVYGDKIGEVTADVEAFGEKMLKSFGIDDDLVKKSIGNMTDLGVKYEDTFKVFTAAADLSAAKNIDLESSINLVTRAYNGNSAMLSRMGVQIADGAEGLAVLDALNASFAGAQAARADTFEVAWERMIQMIDNVKEEIGVGLNESLRELTETVTDIIEAAGPALHLFAETVIDIFSATTKTILGRTDSFWDGLTEQSRLRFRMVGNSITISLLGLIQDWETSIAQMFVNVFGYWEKNLYNPMVEQINSLLYYWNIYQGTLGNYNEVDLLETSTTMRAFKRPSSDRFGAEIDVLEAENKVMGAEAKGISTVGSVLDDFLSPPTGAATGGGLDRSGIVSSRLGGAADTGNPELDSALAEYETASEAYETAAEELADMESEVAETATTDGVTRLTKPGSRGGGGGGTVSGGVDMTGVDPYATSMTVTYEQYQQLERERIARNRSQLGGLRAPIMIYTSSVDPGQVAQLSAAMTANGGN